MAVVTTAPRAMVFGARHDELVIGARLDSTRNHVVETWPAGAAVEFGLRVK